MKFSRAKSKLPSLSGAALAFLSALLTAAAFPDFDYWFLAWFALVPLLFAIERERQSIVKSFVLGWIYGVVFFFASCWWLTFAPATYGGVPLVAAYILFFGATLITGFFAAVFAALFSLLLKRFGDYAILSVPFLWTATEFLRFWITGNNWNAIGYSQAFESQLIRPAQIGGVYAVGFLIMVFNAVVALNSLGIVRLFTSEKFLQIDSDAAKKRVYLSLATALLITPLTLFTASENNNSGEKIESRVVAVQPNVPMSGLRYGEAEILRERHVDLAENALRKSNERRTTNGELPTIVIFPESPMNFEYESDRQFQAFLRSFAQRNNAAVLFNSAQPNTRGTNLFNSAVMVDRSGRKIAQYDKIHLVPFGETVPLPGAIAEFVPTMVGNFEVGSNYNLFPLGNDIKGGVMICFESHFASLSSEFVRSGADVLIEMTNDGYLGETPILRQHLANAVFRAVETDRPVLRVTNTGITAFITERGKVLDALDSYTAGARVWTISKSGGAQTFYVRYGDLFAWLCSLASLALLFWSFLKKSEN